MPVIIPAGFMQVTFEFQGEIIPDGIGATVFGVDIDVNPPGDVLADCAASWLAVFQGSLHNSVTFVRAVGITEATSHEALVDEDGEASGNPVPPNVALHVRKFTGFRGRRGIGHMYPPGLLYDDAVNPDGTLDPTVQAGRQDQYEEWLTTMEATMVLLNRSEGGSTPPATPREVTALLVDNRVSTQRGRLR